MFFIMSAISYNSSYSYSLAVTIVMIFFDMHLNLTPLRCLLLFFHSTNPARHSIFSPSFNFNLSNWLMSQITEKTSDTVSVQV